MAKKRPAGKINQSDAASAYRLKASVESLRDNKASMMKRTRALELRVANLVEAINRLMSHDRHFITATEEADRAFALELLRRDEPTKGCKKS